LEGGRGGRCVFGGAAVGRCCFGGAAVGRSWSESCGGVAVCRCFGGVAGGRWHGKLPDGRDGFFPKGYCEEQL